MVFAFVEDGTLEVYETATDAIRQYEGIDVEDGVVDFYDERGTHLEPRFSTPNKRGTILGLIGWVQSGTYELVPNSASARDSFASALYETQELEPNKWFGSLEELKASLRAQGVEVELKSKQT